MCRSVRRASEITKAISKKLERAEECIVKDQIG